MGKAFLGAFFSLIAAVAITGAIAWNSNDTSHRMVMDEDSLKSLIDQQKESHGASLQINASN